MIVFRRHLALAHLGATRSARKRNEISISSSSLMLCCISIFSLRELLKFRWAGGGRLGPARGSRTTGKSSRFSSRGDAALLSTAIPSYRDRSSFLAQMLKQWSGSPGCYIELLRTQRTKTSQCDPEPATLATRKAGPQR